MYWFRIPSSPLGKSTYACSQVQGRPDVLAYLIAHLMAERDLRQPLQLVTALLRHRRVEALCALCCEMERAGNVAQMATLLFEAARYHTKSTSSKQTYVH